MQNRIVFCKKNTYIQKITVIVLLSIKDTQLQSFQIFQHLFLSGLPEGELVELQEDSTQHDAQHGGLLELRGVF